MLVTSFASSESALQKNSPNYLNGIRPAIKFGKKKDLPFLDTLARRRVDGGLDISVYWKPTHADNSNPLCEERFGEVSPRQGDHLFTGH